MSLIVKLRKFLGLDKNENYMWLGAEMGENWQGSKVVAESTMLYGKSHCYLLLEEEVNLYLEGDFEGVIVGKKKTRLVSKEILVGSYPAKNW